MRSMPFSSEKAATPFVNRWQTSKYRKKQRAAGGCQYPLRIFPHMMGSSKSRCDRPVFCRIHWAELPRKLPSAYPPAIGKRSGLCQPDGRRYRRRFLCHAFLFVGNGLVSDSANPVHHYGHVRRLQCVRHWVTLWHNVHSFVSGAGQCPSCCRYFSVDDRIFWVLS